nr:uncharacterized protein LOC123289203 [Equus asinus]
MIWPGRGQRWQEYKTDEKAYDIQDWQLPALSCGKQSSFLLCPICGPKDSPSTWGGDQLTAGHCPSALAAQRRGNHWTLVGILEAGVSHPACRSVVSRDHPGSGPSDKQGAHTTPPWRLFCVPVLKWQPLRIPRHTAAGRGFDCAALCGFPRLTVFPRTCCLHESTDIKNPTVPFLGLLSSLLPLPRPESILTGARLSCPPRQLNLGGRACPKPQPSRLSPGRAGAAPPSAPRPPGRRPDVPAVGDHPPPRGHLF